MPNQTDDHTDNFDTPDGVVPYPSLSFHAVRWLNQRSGGASGGYPDLPKVLTPVFYDQVDASQPVAVLRTHREEAIRHHLGITDTEGQLTTRVIELLVAICSFAPKEPGPRLINELVCHPADYDRVVGLTTLPGRTPREYHTLKQHGMFGGTMAEPPEASSRVRNLSSRSTRLHVSALILLSCSRLSTSMSRSRFSDGGREMSALNVMAPCQWDKSE